MASSSASNNPGTAAPDPALSIASPDFPRMSAPNALGPGASLDYLPTREMSWIQHSDGSPPPKRLRTAMSYPRKRAVTACALCRARKTKCDNGRPACSSCVGLGVECNYQQASDQSSFDQASLLIIEKLNHVIGMLETPSDRRSLPLSSPLAPTVASLAKVLSPESIPSAVADSGEDISDAPRFYSCCETILNWPIFGRPYDVDKESLVYKYGHQDTDESLIQQNSRFTRDMSRGIDEEDFLELVGAFLAKVHTKNPILDPTSLRKSARWVAENGLGWDGQSCLVLIACALGTISRTFQIVTEDGPIPKCEIVRPGSADYQRAHAYYLAAMKRIGLLGSSLTGAQCHFFAGVFEMYCLRPLRAWSHFNKAACVLQVYTRLAVKKPEPSTSKERQQRSLEQRLYWSCFKSEMELRTELSMPPSGIGELRSPNMLPSPPPEATGNEGSPDSVTTVFEEANSWWYYLSDIAARRILNSVLHAFYGRKESIWVNSRIDKMLRILSELEAQLDTWKENLPHQLKMDYDQPKTWEELPFFTWSLNWIIRDLLYRPFLFSAIHMSESDPNHHVVMQIARKAIETHIFVVKHVCTAHRHHGNWYAQRHGYALALQLIAALKSGKFQMELQGRWRTVVDTIMQSLADWEDEAPDLRGARETILSFLEDIPLEY